MKAGQMGGTNWFHAGQEVGESGQKQRDIHRDNLARAHPSFGGDVPLVPRDKPPGQIDGTRYRDNPPPEGRASRSRSGHTERDNGSEQPERRPVPHGFQLWIAALSGALIGTFGVIVWRAVAAVLA
jgi:hypothetical protein